MQRLSHAAGGVAGAIGAVSLLGGVASLDVLTSILPGSIAMSPATAAALVFAGVATYLLSSSTPSKFARSCGVLCAVGVMLIGLLALSSGAFDRLWEINIPPSSVDSQANRTATNTAVCLVLIGLALLMQNMRPRRGLCLAQPLALAVTADALLILVAYGFGAMPKGYDSNIVMPLNTAVALLALSLGILCIRADRGIMAVVISHNAGGLVIRLMLPVILVLAIALGWLRLMGERAGWYENEFGVAVMVALNVISITAALWWTASRINRLDAERQQVQLDLHRAHAELEKRVRARTVELAEANRELNQKNQENETFVYSVSHDLRSPLVNLQGFSKELGHLSGELHDIVADSQLPPNVLQRALSIIDDGMGESIHFIQTAVMRLSSIIDALLHLSRAGRVEYRYQPTDLSVAVRRIVEAMSDTIAERGVTVTVCQLEPAWGDSTALEQVFANLIGNAIKYLDPSRAGNIEVGCKDETGRESQPSPEGFHTYFVRDNGLGIPTASHEKVFQAFQRLHLHAAPGDGMGLAIVRRIVERHAGRIWIESEVGEGSTFYVMLPANSASAAAARREDGIFFNALKGDHHGA